MFIAGVQHANHPPHFGFETGRHRKRRVSLVAIMKRFGGWLAQQTSRQAERDFVVLGDMNLQNQAELHADTPANFISLNDGCSATNLNPNGPRPFDHVLFSPRFTAEIDREFGFRVLSLIEVMRTKWRGPGAYPGEPFQQNVFRYYYSDHNPMLFRMRIPARDDD